jgi:signal transduction histidine kinase
MQASPSFLYAFEGILAFQLIYILSQYLFIRRKEYLWYAAYIGGILFYATIMYGQLPGRFKFDKVLPILCYVFYYRFACTFLDLKQLSPRIYSWINKLEKVLIIYIIADVIWKFVGQTAYSGEIAFQAIAFSLFICTFVFIVAFLKNKRQFAYFIVIGAIIIALGSLASMIALIFKQNGHEIDFDPLIFNNLAVSLELLVFTTGLAYKARKIELEKSTLSRSYAMELENNLKLEHELNQVKNKISEEIHQELGEGISNISVYTGIAEKQARTENNLLRETLGRIKRISSEIHNSLQDLSWTLNHRNSQQGKLIEKFIQIEREEILPANLKLEIIYTKTDDDRQLPLSFSRQAINALRKGIRLTLQENLENPKLVIQTNEMTITVKKPDLTMEEINGLYGNTDIQWIENDKEISTTLKLTNFSD